MPKHDDTSQNTGHRCMTVPTKDGPRLMAWNASHSMVGTWAQAFGQGACPLLTHRPN